ncbi:hypothetical protein SCHPADRAFT_943731 [Schizopora paradoxa]|uniref:Uncharacterized protein n=1 Tax=Schizopora paradoxa TaxID=27342 RepID=A0A0H2RBT9_9AGAM|nr:hypothetical protein SCHPADRAFT_943731 [Schizopora paradoxa]
MRAIFLASLLQALVSYAALTSYENRALISSALSPTTILVHETITVSSDSSVSVFTGTIFVNRTKIDGHTVEILSTPGGEPTTITEDPSGQRTTLLGLTRTIATANSTTTATTIGNETSSSTSTGTVVTTGVSSSGSLAIVTSTITGSTTSTQTSTSTSTSNSTTNGTGSSNSATSRKPWSSFLGTGLATGLGIILGSWSASY